MACRGGRFAGESFWRQFVRVSRQYWKGASPRFHQGYFSASCELQFRRALRRGYEDVVDAVVRRGPYEKNLGEWYALWNRYAACGFFCPPLPGDGRHPPTRHTRTDTSFPDPLPLFFFSVNSINSRGSGGASGSKTRNEVCRNSEKL